MTTIFITGEVTEVHSLEARSLEVVSEEAEAASAAAVLEEEASGGGGAGSKF